MSAFLDLFDLIGELARRRYQLAERCFSALGLNHTEARLLTLLWKQGGVAPQDALSNLLSVDRTNAGRALQSLEQGNYIRRRKDKVDKRANYVQITAKGRNTVGEIGKLRKQMVAGFFGSLEEAEAGVILNLLRKSLPDEDAARRGSQP